MSSIDEFQRALDIIERLTESYECYWACKQTDETTFDEYDLVMHHHWTEAVNFMESHGRRYLFQEADEPTEEDRDAANKLLAEALAVAEEEEPYWDEGDRGSFA